MEEFFKIRKNRQSSILQPYIIYRPPSPQTSPSTLIHPSLSIQPLHHPTAPETTMPETKEKKSEMDGVVWPLFACNKFYVRLVEALGERGNNILQSRLEILAQ